MEDEQLLRYSRQIMLAGLDIEGQERLLGATALIVGLGGLGSPIAMYLAAAGVGRLILADFDEVDLTNLQRQIVHETDAVGTAKVESAAARLRGLNPEITVEPVNQRLDAENLHSLVGRADVVVEGTDNFTTRFAVNRACVAAARPLVAGAAIRMEGQVAVFDARDPESACYRCVFPEAGETEERCAETGVLAPVPGIIGSIQATEAIKLLTGLGEPLINRMLILDAAAMTWRTLKLRRDPACPVCGSD
ncbi:molybdopterin-synthase adenylyltransferase MoeB [Ectothiorhodospiraceae bacterium WFHF3C12]|nr:molybdopterin-synthase adenylyltransferase MoeB [Ectothiorhodospiraceae bacterium WFHF3C12]